MTRWLQTVRGNRLALLGITLAVMLIGTIVWNLVTPRSDPWVAAMRKRGYPVTPAELNAWYPAVPAAENAALIYTNAFARLTNSSSLVTNFLGRSWLPSLGKSLSAQEKTELASILDANYEALALLHSVPASGRSRYPLDLTELYTLALPHLSKTKQAVTLLAAEAVMHAGYGNAEEAARTLLAAGRVAESLADEPLVVSQFVRNMDWAIVLPRLEHALSLTAFTDNQLAALQSQVEIAERPQATLRSWVSEWVVARTVFHDRKAMDSAFSVVPSTVVPKVATLAPWLRAGCMGLLRATGQQQKDAAFYSDYVCRHVAAMELPYPARFAATRRAQAVTNVPSRLYIFSEMLLSMVPRWDPRDAEHVARVRVAATVLAIERFRLAHTNSLPDSLDQLVPSCLHAALPDPFNGQPLRYTKHGASYVVYSVGSDLKDNGGVDWDANCLKTPADISMVVKR